MGNAFEALGRWTVQMVRDSMDRELKLRYANALRMGAEEADEWIKKLI